MGFAPIWAFLFTFFAPCRKFFVLHYKSRNIPSLDGESHSAQPNDLYSAIYAWGFYRQLFRKFPGPALQSASGSLFGSIESAS